MAKAAIKILLVSGTDETADMLRQSLKDSAEARFDLTWASDVSQAEDKLKAEHFDVVLVDTVSSQGKDQQALDRVTQAAPDTPVLSLPEVGGYAGGEAIGEGTEEVAIKRPSRGAVVGRAILLTVRKYAKEHMNGHHQELEWMVQQRTTEMENALTALKEEFSDRMRMDEALHASERFSRGILDSLTSNIAVLDSSGVILDVNEAWRKFASENGAKSDFLGRNYLEICESATGPDAEIARGMAKGIRDVIAGRTKEFSTEYACPLRTGEGWFRMRATRFAGPGPVRVVVVHADITKQHQTDRAIEQLEMQFRRLAEIVPVVFCLASIDMKTIYYVNPAYEKIWGRSRQSLLENGMSWMEAVHPDDRQRVESFTKRNLALAASGGANIVTFEFRLIRPDGAEATVRIDAFPITDANGKVCRIGCIVEDVTLLRHVEELCDQITESLENYASILVQRAPNAVIATWDAQAEKLLGPPANEVLHRPLAILARPDPRGTIARLLERMAAVKAFMARLKAINQQVQ